MTKMPRFPHHLPDGSKYRLLPTAAAMIFEDDLGHQATQAIAPSNFHKTVHRPEETCRAQFQECRRASINRVILFDYLPDTNCTIC